MKKIDVYILKETIGPFFVGLTFFTFIFVIDRVRNLIQMTMEKGVGLDITLQLFFYMLPFTAAITIPMGVLFAIIFSYGRISGDSEITAMRATGASIYRIFVPAGIVGILSTVLMFLFINYLVPVTNYRYKTLYRAVLYANPGIMMRDRVFTDVPNSQKKISSAEISDDGNFLKSVFIYEYEKKEENIKITYADEGEWINNDLNSPLIILKLKNGRTMEMNFENDGKLRQIDFKQLSLNIENKIKTPKEHTKGLREISAGEIMERIRKRQKDKGHVTPYMWVEYHKKFSIPAACLVFVLAGVPLSVTFSRSGKGVSFVMSIIIIFIYYLFMHLGEVLGKKEIIPPQLSMWLPNVIVFILGLIFLIRKARE